VNIDLLVDMPDDEFADAVMQAFKRRDSFPEWWRAVLSPGVIDDTERVLVETLERAEVQARTPERYPQAASFALKIRRNALPELALARVVMGE
jgi:hypothetical protein